MFLVSACLLGVRCRYNGTDAYCPEIVESLANTACVPVCPEQLGGLPTPRPPAEIKGGDGRDVLHGAAQVVDELGRDVTSHFIRGAQEALRIAMITGCKQAILKARSPSCGCGEIYRDGQLSEGDGVTTALLKEHGLTIRVVR